MSNNRIVTSPSERVQALSDSFKDVLNLGRRYVELLDQLAQTKDTKNLLSATTKLAKMDLANAFVDFPPHYKAADYYLIFMDRLLKMHGDTAINVAEEELSHEFKATVASIGDEATFKFEIDSRGEAAFTEQSQHEPLFYLSLEEKLMQFNNRALVNYFIIYALKQHTDLELRDAVKPMVAFAKYLQKDLDFTIDLGILATENDRRFMLAKPELSLTVIDRLFVATADQDYMLMNLPRNNGAELLLDRGIKLDIAFDPDDYSQEWAFLVKDPDAQVSFFDVLLHYELVRKWYLDDRDALAVRTNHMEIADDDSQQLDDVPVVASINDDSTETDTIDEEKNEK
ncbi:hypothetical protein [Limosilactobacillus rudii]|uniref:hypothetical protein n=1 Tax=Limosilactobacillus rudii TaxID=2759755 RepID=UPI001E2E1081|nr:hypothetical protein [Limosilactobacillus rudii]MCD7133633.1 hypothetical protein [Limosilactobacillus rudii]